MFGIGEDDRAQKGIRPAGIAVLLALVAEFIIVFRLIIL